MNIIHFNTDNMNVETLVKLGQIHIEIALWPPRFELGSIELRWPISNISQLDGQSSHTTYFPIWSSINAQIFPTVSHKTLHIKTVSLGGFSARFSIYPLFQQLASSLRGIIASWVLIYVEDCWAILQSRFGCCILEIYGYCLEIYAFANFLIEGQLWKKRQPMFCCKGSYL